MPCHGSPATKCMIDNAQFRTNVLVYPTAALADDRVKPSAGAVSARDAGNNEHPVTAESCEFSNVAIRKARVPANSKPGSPSCQFSRPTTVTLCLHSRRPFGCNVVGVSSACRRGAHIFRMVLSYRTTAVDNNHLAPRPVRLRAKLPRQRYLPKVAAAF
jgi:hypothetical protein